MAAPPTFDDVLHDFFRVHAPAKLVSVPEVAKKYAGQQAKLFEFLHKRYKAERRGEPAGLEVVDGSDAGAGASAGGAAEALEAGAGGAPLDPVVGGVLRALRLDPRSKFFDPSLALYDPTARPPIPHVPPRDNIVRCRRLLPEGDPNNQGIQARPPAGPKPGARPSGPSRRPGALGKRRRGQSK